MGRIFFLRILTLSVLTLASSCVFGPETSTLDGIDESVQEFNRTVGMMKGPCKTNSDCKLVPIDGPCCGCSFAMSKKSKHQFDQARMETLCHEMSLRKDDEELVSCDCDSEDRQVECLQGTCVIR